MSVWKISFHRYPASVYYLILFVSNISDVRGSLVAQDNRLVATDGKERPEKKYFDKLIQILGFYRKLWKNHNLNHFIWNLRKRYWQVLENRGSISTDNIRIPRGTLTSASLTVVLWQSLALSPTILTLDLLMQRIDFPIPSLALTPRILRANPCLLRANLRVSNYRIRMIDSFGLTITTLINRCLKRKTPLDCSDSDLFSYGRLSTGNNIHCFGLVTRCSMLHHNTNVANG